MIPGVYISGAGVISPQKTFNNEVFEEDFILEPGNRKKCIEPDYSLLIDAKQIRRMSRIIRMSIASSITALKNAGINNPEAVVVGTAFGCLDDTYSFLSKLVQFKEDMLSPTAFIHSTHNTIASQIALHYKCYGYNSTYVHRSVSFESALADAVMMLQAEEVNNVLVGGADEIIDASFAIMDRMGRYKKNESSDGAVAGEGAAFFSLVTNHSNKCMAKVAAVESWSHVSKEEVIQNIQKLLKANNINSPASILTGINGDLSDDLFTAEITTASCPESKTINYKHLCGEYGTASSFATWMAASMLKNQLIPTDKGFEKIAGTALKNILIYNQTNKIHHSVILLEAC